MMHKFLTVGEFFFHFMTSVHVLQVISHVSVHAIFLFKVQQAES